MDAYKTIENMMAIKYTKQTTTRKAIGDFMLSDDHAVNVKSNNVDKQNYSPNMISIKKMHEWVYEQKKNLSFIFVDYKEDGSDIIILNESEPIPMEQISWNCLSIEAQGYGVIQKVKTLEVNQKLTKKDFYEGFLSAYEKYRNKEIRKHEKFSERFIKDVFLINW